MSRIVSSNPILAAFRLAYGYRRKSLVRGLMVDSTKGR
jgi:hypothetical protein